MRTFRIPFHPLAVALLASASSPPAVVAQGDLNDLEMAHVAVTASDIDMLRGADFDRAYSRNELEYHRTVNGVVEDAFIPNIETPEVREAFQAALVTFRRHEERAELLVRSVEDGAR